MRSRTLATCTGLFWFCRRRGEKSLALKSSVCATPILKQKDHLPVICLCIIYNLLLLKTNVSLHIALVERQQATRRSAAHVSCQQLQIQSQTLWQLTSASVNSQKCVGCQMLRLHNLNSTLLPWYCPYRLWYCSLFFSGATLSV